MWQDPNQSSGLQSRANYGLLQQGFGVEWGLATGCGNTRSWDSLGVKSWLYQGLSWAVPMPHLKEVFELPEKRV